MAKKRKSRVEQAAIVQRFAARLREVRTSRGMTQAELARTARVTQSYIYRLESALVAPGIDLVERIAAALGSTIHDLLPLAESPDTKSVLTDRAEKLFHDLKESADRETLLMLCPLLARLAESPTRRR
jgi:transcriptional regulator with XRE-family HTH domain